MSQLDDAQPKYQASRTYQILGFDGYGQEQLLRLARANVKSNEDTITGCELTRQVKSTVTSELSSLSQPVRVTYCTRPS